MIEVFFETNPIQLLLIPTIGIQELPECRVIAISWLNFSIGLAFYPRP